METKTIMGIIAAFTIITIIVVVIIVFKDKFAKLFDGFLNLFSLGGILTGDRVPRDSVVADCPDTYTNNGHLQWNISGFKSNPTEVKDLFLASPSR